MTNKFFEPLFPKKNKKLPPGQHVTNKLPIMSHWETPVIASDDWRLDVTGPGINRTVSFSDLLSLPVTEFSADFHCVTRWSSLNVHWTGVKITDVLAGIEIGSEIKSVMQYCADGYNTSLPWDAFFHERNYLCFKLSGEWLPVEHGGPVRSLIPYLYGWKSAKWISRIEMLDTVVEGFWEKNGYHHRGDPWKEERFDG